MTLHTTRGSAVELSAGFIYWLAFLLLALAAVVFFLTRHLT